MRYASLFAGIGGFDLGFERAGMSPAWQVEIDPVCRQVLARRFPSAIRLEDVRHVGAGNLQTVAVVCGGFPCQDLSVAGRRAGLAGARSGLWWEFHRILAEIRPRWCVIENVPGLLSGNGGRDMGTILWALGQLGYGYAYRVLDAQWFGVAQRRRRVFIVGCLGDGRRAAEVLLEPEGGVWDSPPSRAARSEATGPLGGGSGRPGWADDLDRSGAFIPEVVRALTAPGGPRYDGDTETFVTQALTASLGRGGPDDNKAQGGFYVIQDVRGGTRDRTDHGQGIGISDGDVCYTLSATERHAVAFQPQAGGKTGFAIGDQAPALIGSQVAAVQGQWGVRRLTPRECERLQGFPDDWTRWGADGKEISDSARYRMLGNAVCVPVAEWIGRRILAARAAWLRHR